MTGKKWLLSLVITLLLGGGAGAYYAFRQDPMVAQAMNLQKQMQQEGLSREDRGKMWGEMRQTMEQLTPEQRDQVFQNMRRDSNGWMARERAREQKRMDEFFAMNKKDRTKALDKEIDEMVKRDKEREKRRKEREKERAQSGQTAGGNGGPGGGGPGGGGPGGGGPGGGGGGRGGPGGGGGDRNERRRLSMDNSSASQRAQRSAYREQMADRMRQRGIPMTGGGRGGPGGRGF